MNELRASFSNFAAWYENYTFFKKIFNTKFTSKNASLEFKKYN